MSGILSMDIAIFPPREDVVRFHLKRGSYLGPDFWEVQGFDEKGVKIRVTSRPTLQQALNYCMRERREK